MSLKIDVIFQGNFGEVWKGKIKLTGGKFLDVAIKTCHDVLPDSEKKKFMSEARILRRYDHPNIVRFIGVAAQKNPMMIVMELAPGQ